MSVVWRGVTWRGCGAAWLWRAQEHLFIVCELLRDNLYELYKYIQRNDWTPYFTLPRIRAIAHQCLTALAFIHANNLIHCDLKPENILIKSLSKCLVKVPIRMID